MDEEKYTSSHTGQEIDAAVNAVGNKADVVSVGSGTKKIPISQLPWAALYNVEAIASCNSNNKLWYCTDGKLYYRKDGSINADGKDFDMGTPAYILYYNGNKIYKWSGSGFVQFDFGSSGGSISFDDTSSGDFEIADEEGNVILRLSGGGIKTQNFDSASLANKQDRLVSGTNIRTINGISLLGSGNIVLEGGEGGSSGTVVEDSIQYDLSLFFIGNSFAMDAIPYVPWILSEIAPEVKIKLGCAFYANCSLSMHKTKMGNDSADYTYYRYPTSSGNLAWEATQNKKMSEMINPTENWDIISLQEVSGSAGNYNTISASLQSCMDYAKTFLGRTPEFWWLMGQTRLNSNYPTHSEVAEVCQKIMDNYDIEELIPVGTAIENARGTSLNSVGNGLTADTAHLQEGLPVLIAGYAVVMTILNRLGIAKTVLGNSYTFSTSPTPSGAANGSVVGMTDENRLIGQKCAILADKFKYWTKTIY